MLILYDKNDTALASTTKTNDSFQMKNDIPMIPRKKDMINSFFKYSIPTQ